MREPGRILIVSCYELGHQPLAAASALGFLERAGYRPAALDLSVEGFDKLAARTRCPLARSSAPDPRAGAREGSPAGRVCIRCRSGSAGGIHEMIHMPWVVWHMNY